MNDGEGGFDDFIQVPGSANQFSDVDGDGDLDLVSSTGGGGGVRAWAS